MIFTQKHLKGKEKRKDKNYKEISNNMVLRNGSAQRGIS